MEIWKLLKKNGNDFNVSSRGNIQVGNGSRGIPFTTVQSFSLNGGHEGNRYLSTHGQYVHRLVAEAFIGEIPEGYTVNHKDGNKLNNDVSNLEIITYKENNNHAWDLGIYDHIKLTQAEMHRREVKTFFKRSDNEWFVLDLDFNVLGAYATVEEAAASIGVSRQSANNSYRKAVPILGSFFICRRKQAAELKEKVQV